MTKTVMRYTQPCVQTQPGLEFKVEEVELFEDPKGKWVRYEDIKHLLQDEPTCNCGCNVPDGHHSQCPLYRPRDVQLCPHCGKSEPHTHRVPGSAEPVIFPHGPPVNRPAPHD